MPGSHANILLRHIRRLAVRREPDDELLRRFLEQRDQTAFATLVERHGAMVLSVCRSVLGHQQDAEDAVQATFLVLAGKAGSIYRRDGLASWLHGVALRIARKARAARRRQQTMVMAVPSPGCVSPADGLSWGEVREVLHQELAALPQRLREPLVLCYLQGLTQEETARRLGWTPAMVKGCVQRGRERLRRRLERRGLGLATVLGAAALTGSTEGAVLPAVLALATVQTVLANLAATVLTPAGLLARGALTSWVPAKLKVLAGVLLLSTVLAVGAVLLPQKTADSPTSVAVPTPSQGPLAHPLTDPHGDSLPDGAVARLGSNRFNHGERLQAVFYSPDGKTIISFGGGFLCRWDAESGKELARFATPRPTWDDQALLTPDGKELMVLSQDDPHDTLRTYDLSEGKMTAELPLPITRRMQSIYQRNALAPDGRLCALHTPQQIAVCHTVSGRQLWQLPRGGDEIQLVFAGNDRLITTNKEQTVEIWEARTGKLVRKFAHGVPVQFLTASRDGRWLATLEHHTHAIDRWLDRDVVHVWDLATCTEKHVLPAVPKSWYIKVLFSPDSKLLYTSSSGNKGYALTVWDVATGQHLRDLDGTFGPMAVSPDGRRLAGGWVRLGVCDAQTGQGLPFEDSKYGFALAVSLSPRADRAFTFGFNSISTWDAGTGQRLHSFDVPHFGNSRPPTTFSPDGRYAVTFTAEDFSASQILIWDTGARRRLHTIPTGCIACVFSPDSSCLATASTGKEGVALHLWNMATGKEIRSFKETKTRYPNQLFFSADGQTLFVVGWCVAGYEIATGKELFSCACSRCPPLDPLGLSSVAGL